MNKITQHIKEKLRLFRDFWQAKGDAVLKVAKDFSLPGVDCICATDTGCLLALKCKTRIQPDDIDVLQILQSFVREKKCVLILLADGMSQATAQQLIQKKLSFYISEENAAICIPGFTYFYCISSTPSAKRVFPKEHSVFVGRGSRLCRTLLTNRNRIWSQVELVRATCLNKGYVSILMRKMEAEGHVHLHQRKYTLTDFDKLLDAWVMTYDFRRFRAIGQYAISGRNYLECVRKTANALAKCGETFAFTGWTSAALRAPYAEPPQIMAYVDKLPDCPELLPVSVGGNVFLAVPADMGRLQHTQIVDQIPLVCDVQAYLDLKKMPGRASDQAEYYRDSLLK